MIFTLQNYLYHVRAGPYHVTSKTAYKCTFSLNASLATNYGDLQIFAFTLKGYIALSKGPHYDHVKAVREVGTSVSLSAICLYS